MENKNTIVSNDFIEIYKNYNVINQVEEMKKLSKRELYLLLTVALDKFNENDPVAKSNFTNFKKELLEIFDLQDDKSSDSFLLEIANETGDKYIETDYIYDSLGNKLPEPLTKEEVRDAKINIIESF